MEIKKHKNVTYKSMEDMLRGEAQVFIDRAKVYLDEGKLDRAIGCLNKAMVNIKRADVLKLSPLEEKLFSPKLFYYYYGVIEVSKIEAAEILQDHQS